MSLRARILAVSALALLLFGARAVFPRLAAPVAAFGRGPAIVLVRGLGSDTGRWLPTARILARRHRVAFVDLPGSGISALPGLLSLESATRTLDMALARVSRQPVVLVGHSLGGLVAAAEACARPGRVRALVLVETSLRPRGAWTEQRTAPDPAVVGPWSRLALETDLSARVARLRCPLLVVLAPGSWPRGEPWVEAAAALGFGAVPRVRAVRVDGCGHFVMIDRPDELARLIGRFADAPDGGPVVLAVWLADRAG